MFELIISGHRPLHGRTAASVVVSIGGHVGLLLVAVVLPLLYATDQLPHMPAMMAFVAAEPAPPPSPPPPPPRTARRPKPQPQPAAVTAAAPIEAPVGIVSEAPSPPGEDVLGVEGGVEGGLVGGVVWGVVGGLVASLAPPPPPQPPPAPRGPVWIGGQIMAPALVFRVEPQYPAIAVAARLGGVVIIEATVGADGRVESAKILRSVKFLDEAAIEAVSQWRYSPLILNGIPMPFILTVTLSFSIGR